MVRTPQRSLNVNVKEKIDSNLASFVGLMLLWEMSVLCEDRKGKGKHMGCNYPPVEWATRMTKPL